MLVILLLTRRTKVSSAVQCASHYVYQSVPMCMHIHVYKGAAKCVKVCELLAKCILQSAKVCQCEAKCSLQWIKVFQSVLTVYQYVCPAVCIPLCAIIFGAGSRSLELQLQAFPRRLPMMNVDVHHRNYYLLRKTNSSTIATWPQLWLWWSSWSWTLTDLTTASLPCAHSRLVFVVLQHHRLFLALNERPVLGRICSILPFLIWIWQAASSPICKIASSKLKLQKCSLQ